MSDRFSEMSRAIHSIIETESEDLRVLARAAGFDPSNFYIGADLDGVDIRGQDLTGMDFTGASFEGVIMDDGTIFDAAHDPRLRTRSPE